MTPPPSEPKPKKKSNEHEQKLALESSSLKIVATESDQNHPTESRNSPSKTRQPDKGGQEAVEGVASTTNTTSDGGGMVVEVNGRERLKRHRVEVAGRVWIPDMWGQEELLKDWIDCTAFDASLVSSSIMSARAALVEDGRLRASSSGLRIANRIQWSKRAEGITKYSNMIATWGKD